MNYCYKYSLVGSREDYLSGLGINFVWPLVCLLTSQTTCAEVKFREYIYLGLFWNFPRASTWSTRMFLSQLSGCMVIRDLKYWGGGIKAPTSVNGQSILSRVIRNTWFCLHFWENCCIFQESLVMKCCDCVGSMETFGEVSRNLIFRQETPRR